MPYLTRSEEENESVDCRILTAALDLFVERGYHNVSVHDVQKTASVSIGSIYNHFGGKQGIAEALYKHLLQEIDDLITDVLERQPKAITRIEEIVRRLFNHTESHSHIISYVLHTKHCDFLPDAESIYDSEPFKRVQQIVEQAIADKEIKSMDSQLAMSIVFGSALNLIYLRLDGVLKQPLDGKIFTDWSQAVWRGLK